ncbi:MAG: hypothetical protein WCW66_06530 [Patescibacteria group bacterium]
MFTMYSPFSFPENIPTVDNIVRIMLPDGLEVETTIRQRDVNHHTGDIRITIKGNNLNGFDPTLGFRDGKWFATHHDTAGMEIEVFLKIVEEC